MHVLGHPGWWVCAARTLAKSRRIGQCALVYPDRDLASDARGPTLRTQRLVLRRWRAEDLAPFAELNADPDVMAHMQKTMSREESDAFVARIEEEFEDCGFGLWAVEVPNRSPFIGLVGLHRGPFDAPFTPAVEVGWRLAVLSREVGHLNGWPAPKRRVTPVMVVEVEPAVKSSGALSI